MILAAKGTGRWPVSIGAQIQPIARREKPRLSARLVRDRAALAKWPWIVRPGCAPRPRTSRPSMQFLAVGGAGGFLAQLAHVDDLQLRRVHAAVRLFPRAATGRSGLSAIG